VNEVFDAETQQLQFGLAMKTMHDHPIIVDALSISPDGGPAQTVMAPALSGGGNRLEITLRPADAGRVAQLLVGGADLDGAACRLLRGEDDLRPAGAAARRARNDLRHRPVRQCRTGAADRSRQRPDAVHAAARLRPRSASDRIRAGARDARARTCRRGQSRGAARLGAGGRRPAGQRADRAALVVWRTLVPPVRAARIDPDFNPQWAVLLNESRGRFDLQGTLTIDSGTGPVVLAVMPGIYAVSVEVTRRQQTQTGITRTTRSESNQIAFSVGARIDTADPPNAQGRIVLHVVNLFDMLAAELDVQLAVDGILYNETAAFANNPLQDRGLFVRQVGRARIPSLVRSDDRGRASAAAHDQRRGIATLLDRHAMNRAALPKQ
jgi:hypothetical protein